jgi:hypothetical protein|tara:strand:- start:384 stop:623 length:240 start_codon:yes stop_codon:yes gene_type:complete
VLELGVAQSGDGSHSVSRFFLGYGQPETRLVGTRVTALLPKCLTIQRNSLTEFPAFEVCIRHEQEEVQMPGRVGVDQFV